MTRDYNMETWIPDVVWEETGKLHTTRYLFGSRWMPLISHGLPDDTDWDFAFPYEGSEQLEIDKAESLGWVKKPTEKYKDQLHFITWEKVVDGYKIQMCSKINLRFFIDSFRSIDPDFYWKYLHRSSYLCLPKETQCAIFNQIYRSRGW
jgi:hypothetical protein